MWGIFSSVVAWLTNLAKGMAYWFAELFRLLIKMFTQAWAVWLFLCACVWIAFKDMGLMIGSLLNLVGSLTGPGGTSLSAPGSAANWLAVANTFAPLDECFGYLIIYLHLVVGFGIYKLAKSWIPTVAGGGA